MTTVTLFALLHQNKQTWKLAPISKSAMSYSRVTFNEYLDAVLQRYVLALPNESKRHKAASIFCAGNKKYLSSSNCDKMTIDYKIGL